MLDVLIAGAGPAGTIAARELARAGARVLLVDREAFPRDKLCGDTVNPGAIRFLGTLGLAGGPLATARPLEGMRVTGPGASVVARYGGAVAGVSISRRDLDAWLLDEAIAAGVKFQPEVTVQGALTEDIDGERRVRGLILRNVAGTVTRVPALVTIGADGRRSAVARSVGLGSHPSAPRRWAFGSYYTSVTGTLAGLGEMHVRPRWYCGINPLADGRVNVCVVTDRREGADDPHSLILRYLRSDHELAGRFAQAERVAPVTVLGPLAFDVATSGAPGLLLAGDAAGFVDPITGDGLNLAMQGAVMAAESARDVLHSGDWNGVVARLNARRTATLGTKSRFNRAMRVLTSSPTGVRLAGVGARLAPGILQRIIVQAGDAA